MQAGSRTRWPAPRWTNLMRSTASFRRHETRRSCRVLRHGYSCAECAARRGGFARSTIEGRCVRGRILIYGGTGYTGRLIAEHARNAQRAPVIAGRTAHRVQTLAAELALPGRVITLDEPEAIDDALGDVAVLINAASPYARTARPLIEACLRTRTHYLDITGELPIFQGAASYDEAAR